MPPGWLPPSVRALGRRVTEHLLGVTTFDAICAEMPSHDAADFSAMFLKTMGVRIECAGLPAETAPASGPLIVIANHPFGLIEVMAIDALFPARRADSRTMGLYLVGQISAYRDRMFPVDPLGRRSRRAMNAKAWRQAFRWIAGGGAFLMFPAGRVARFRWTRIAVADRPWKPHVAALARKTGAPILPIYFHGHNSWLFQLVGMLLPPLEQVLLLHEVNNKRDRVVRATIGRLITPDELARFGTDEAATAFLREKTDGLARLV